MASRRKHLSSGIDRADQTLEEPFDDLHDFFDDVHGQVVLNSLERELVDTPEFQRLFRVSQLGFVDLLYPTANHTRAAHSIGTCHSAAHLVRRLNHNNARLAKLSKPPKDARIVTRAETVLIRLGALLHDLSHGPFSHDIEKKTHYIFPRDDDRTRRLKVRSYHGAYEKHDDWLANPSLYITIFGDDSILARVLRAYSPRFWTLLASEEQHAAFTKAAQTVWKNVEREVLPALVFHLLVYEKIEDALKGEPLTLRKTFDDPPETWWFGSNPKNWKTLHDLWYQPYRHDIIGDTLSADLIDYIARDMGRLAMTGGVDENLLRFYVLAQADFDEQGRPIRKGLYRCAIELWDYKRGTVRSERINDVFRLLDLRHEIHEKAVFHRIVQGATAMLARAIQLLPNKPKVSDLYNLGTPLTSLSGDEHFMIDLQRRWPNSATDMRVLPTKLAERRIYRPLVIIPGDRVKSLFKGDEYNEGEYSLRELAAIIDSGAFAEFQFVVSWLIQQLLDHAIAANNESNGRQEYSLQEILRRAISTESVRDRLRQKRPDRVIFWTLPFKQLYKDPSLLVAAESEAQSIEQLARRAKNHPRFGIVHERIRAGVNDSEQKYIALWKLYVFLSDGLFYAGPLSKVLPGIECSTDLDQHQGHLVEAQRFIVRALRSMWKFWVAKRDSTTDDKELEDWLREPMPPDDFVKLLRILASQEIEEELYQEFAGKVSLVAVDQYLHGDHAPDEPTACRDIRYKHDVKAPIVDPELQKCLIDVKATFSKAENYALKTTLHVRRDEIAAQKSAIQHAGADRNATAGGDEVTKYVNLVRATFLELE